MLLSQSIVYRQFLHYFFPQRTLSLVLSSWLSLSCVLYLLFCIFIVLCALVSHYHQLFICTLCSPVYCATVLLCVVPWSWGKIILFQCIQVIQWNGYEKHLFFLVVFIYSGRNGNVTLCHLYEKTFLLCFHKNFVLCFFML